MGSFNNDHWNLAELANPKNFHESIDVNGYDKKVLLAWLEKMSQIRQIEQHLAKMKKQKYIGGPVHLGVGQEAVSVGVSTWLKKTDRVFGAHRSHAHMLALGSEPWRLFAEVLGRDTGLSKGLGGSMHMWDQPNGFYGSVPIVAGTVSLAVGAGLAAKMQKTGDIAVAYLGDGACEEGIVHESLNFARVYNVPILFVVENNLLSSHMYITQRQPRVSTARFAQAHDISYEIVEGNNAISVSETADRLIRLCREGSGPAFMEAITYRWFGHVDYFDDYDVGVKRSKEEIDEWKKRDPIGRLVRGMIEAGILNDQDFRNIENRIENDILSAWDRAMKEPFPSENVLIDYVYSSKKGESHA